MAISNDILACISEPRQLEKLYRTNRTAFKQAFSSLYPQLKGNPFAEVWHERLYYENEDIRPGTRNQLLLIVACALIAGIISKLQTLLSIDEEFFYTRNISFTVFPLLMIYFGWKNKLPTTKVVFTTAATLAAVIFINSLPDNTASSTLTLSCIHLPIFLWLLFGFVFAGKIKNSEIQRLAFLKYNGDLLVITTLMVIAGGIMSGVTMGLFKLAGFNIEKFYFENIVLFAFPAVPIIGSYLIETNPQLVSRVSPLIAKIFGPLVLIMLVIYLATIFVSPIDPFTDRDSLIVFNILLIAVMAIIFFSISENANQKSRPEVLLLLVLSIVTVVANGVALSAILFRIAQWGFSPNRTAVFGANVLILVHLLLVTVNLFGIVIKKADIQTVGKTIAQYLPVYFVWCTVVTFIFPFLFGLK
jgi:hypothetical protein